MIHLQYLIFKDIFTNNVPICRIYHYSWYLMAIYLGCWIQWRTHIGWNVQIFGNWWGLWPSATWGWGRNWCKSQNAFHEGCFVATASPAALTPLTKPNILTHLVQIGQSMPSTWFLMFGIVFRSNFCWLSCRLNTPWPFL